MNCCSRPSVTNDEDVMASALNDVDLLEVLDSAVRSKMAYLEPHAVAALWKTANNLAVSRNIFEVFIYSQLIHLDAPPQFLTSPCTSNEDAQAYIWRHDNTIYLTYRGTSSKKDILADGDAVGHRVEKGVIVHDGFYKQFRSLHPEVMHFILNNMSAKRLVIAGHSLGGGLAQIAAAYYGEVWQSLEVTCHTFGCPRTGNLGFVKWFSTYVHQHVRVANTNDPVPMVPQRSVWCHTTNKCIMVDDDCNAKEITRDVPWHKRCWQTIADLDFMAPIQDHSCDLYISRMHVLHTSRATKI